MISDKAYTVRGWNCSSATTKWYIEQEQASWGLCT